MIMQMQGQQIPSLLGGDSKGTIAACVLQQIHSYSWFSGFGGDMDQLEKKRKTCPHCLLRIKEI